ncbi:MAG: hypothetical protein JNL42_05375 [Anaerolineae bacterium]|nr:hypothetical protein [Anaerolineae bacterium]
MVLHGRAASGRAAGSPLQSMVRRDDLTGRFPVMPSPRHVESPSPWVALFVCLASLCMLAYSGVSESRDSTRLFDALSSWVEWGDLRLDLAAWENPPTTQTSAWFPLENAAVEPGQIFAAAPLYVLARLLPGVGLAHTVWLFGALTTAAAGVVFARCARLLGASQRAALLAALSLVVATAALPYSKTFFREPLTLLLLLTTACAAFQVRVTRFHSPGWLILLAASVAALLLTRASSLFAIPVLLTLLVPLPGAKADGAPGRFRLSRRIALLWIAAAALLALLVVGLTLWGDRLGLGARYNVAARLLEASAATLPTALHTYLVSPGGSIWGTSPVLLLALPGAWLLIRQRRGRIALASLLAALGFSFGYAVFNGEFWFGGLAWPPRFLVPAIPLVLLSALPVFERAARRPLSLWGALVAVLVVYGVWINLSAISLPLESYSAALPPEANGFYDWGAGLNVIDYLRWRIIPTLWNTQPFDLAWAILETPAMFLAYGGLALLALWGMRRRSRLLTGALVAAWLALTLHGLTLLYAHDPRYQPDNAALDALLPILEAETTRDDVILLSSPRYVPYFQNRGKLLDAGRVIALELQVGERVSESQPALVESDYPPALLTKETSRLVTNLAGTRERLWLVVDGSPDLWWSSRPVEHYLSTLYYPIRVIQTGPLTRLIEFSTVPAPDPFAFRGTALPTDLRFGAAIRLEGVTLPRGYAYAPGDPLAVSLLWMTDAALDLRASVGVYLRDSSGGSVVQNDSMPLNGFSPTDSWLPGAPYWDHRALRLPADLPAGDYALWVKVYTLGADGVVDLPVSGSATLDGVIGVLPVTIHVE